VCVFSHPVCLDFPEGSECGLNGLWKNDFHQALMEPRDLPSFNAVKIARKTSPNQGPIGKRRIKTIFNHFRDKLARIYL
jgi:hypothetical protein